MGDLIWVQSTKNDKVDIITMDMFDFIEQYDIVSMLKEFAKVIEMWELDKIPNYDSDT